MHFLQNKKKKMYLNALVINFQETTKFLKEIICPDRRRSFFYFFFQDQWIKYNNLCRWYVALTFGYYSFHFIFALQHFKNIKIYLKQRLIVVCFQRQLTRAYYIVLQLQLTFALSTSVNCRCVLVCTQGCKWFGQNQ